MRDGSQSNRLHEGVDNLYVWSTLCIPARQRVQVRDSGAHPPPLVWGNCLYWRVHGVGHNVHGTPTQTSLVHFK